MNDSAASEGRKLYFSNLGDLPLEIRPTQAHSSAFIDSRSHHSGLRLDVTIREDGTEAFQTVRRYGDYRPHKGQLVTVNLNANDSIHVVGAKAVVVNKDVSAAVRISFDEGSVVDVSKANNPLIIVAHFRDPLRPSSGLIRQETHRAFDSSGPATLIREVTQLDPTAITIEMDSHRRLMAVSYDIQGHNDIAIQNPIPLTDRIPIRNADFGPLI